MKAFATGFHHPLTRIRCFARWLCLRKRRPTAQPNSRASYNSWRRLSESAALSSWCLIFIVIRRSYPANSSHWYSTATKLHCFILLDPSERNPAVHVKALRSASSLRDVETGDEVSVSAEFLQNEYPQRIRDHIESLQSEALRHGFHYTSCETSEALNEILHNYLMLRQQRR